MSDINTLPGARDWQPGHDHFWSPIDDAGDDYELPPMEPLSERDGAIGKVLAIGVLGFSLCFAIAILVSALAPALLK